MPPLSGTASYNKKPGTLNVSADGKVTTWIATGETKPAKRLDIANITNLQQTPATSAKVSLRIVELVPETKEQKNHTFQFSSDDSGRAQAGAIKELLAAAIQKFKNGDSIPAPAANTPGGAPAAMAIAAAVSAGGPARSSSQFDDVRLLENVALQQRLLAANKQLNSTFEESMKARPASISVAAFDKQFWTSRIKLLRAFAIQQNQKRGDYNVLSTVKMSEAKTHENEPPTSQLKITVEQIHIILKQHPVVRKAKAELSSKLSDTEFWARFFNSRLLKKLKGEKILEHDKKDELFDRYLKAPEDDAEREKKFLAAHLPHTIDLAGNEQDNSQRQGNAPDIDNRPSADRQPILRALNSMSEKLLSQVTPNDVNPSNPIGVDEATFKEMELRDLAGATEAQRLTLHIRDKAKFFAVGKGAEESGVKSLYAKQNPHDVLTVLNDDLNSSNKMSLSDAIGVDDSDSDDDMGEDGQPKVTHVGSRSSRRQATKQVFASISERRARADDQLASTDEADVARELGLEVATYRNISLAQAAATVFLNHFWSVYHAGEHSRAAELEGVTEALAQSLDGIKTAGDAAEKERTRKIDETREQYRAHAQRTGRQRTFDPETIKGGRKAINQLMSSTIRSLEFALNTYKKALDIARAAEAQS